MSTVANRKIHSSSGAEFTRLITRPSFAWPTVLLFIFIVTNYAYSTYSYVTGSLPLWAAIALNSLSVYICYSIMHETAHGLICSNKIINDWIGRISMLMLSITPFINAYRFLHLTHHRNANDPKNDPDYFCGTGPVWQLPFRWMVMDIVYVAFYVKELHQRPQSEKTDFWLSVAFGVTLLSVIIISGHFVTFLLLYLIPTRIALFFLVLAFDYLPHYPHDTLVRNNKFRATNNRIGLEWLLTPLLLGQNYHLSHHLYPTAPFYRYRKVWQSRQQYHDSKKPALVKYYKLKPVNN